MPRIKISRYAFNLIFVCYLIYPRLAYAGCVAAKSGWGPVEIFWPFGLLATAYGIFNLVKQKKLTAKKLKNIKGAGFLLTGFLLIILPLTPFGGTAEKVFFDYKQKRSLPCCPKTTENFHSMIISMAQEGPCATCKICEQR